LARRPPRTAICETFIFCHWKEADWRLKGKEKTGCGWVADQKSWESQIDEVLEARLLAFDPF
jgi:hypothetical protein